MAVCRPLLRSHGVSSQPHMHESQEQHTGMLLHSRSDHALPRPQKLTRTIDYARISMKESLNHYPVSLNHSPAKPISVQPLQQVQAGAAQRSPLHLRDPRASIAHHLVIPPSPVSQQSTLLARCSGPQQCGRPHPCTLRLQLPAGRCTSACYPCFSSLVFACCLVTDCAA